MERKIKFRAWDKVEKRMVENHRLAIMADGSEVYYLDKTPTWFDVAGFNRNLILMQFTGHHDKNENDVYEGDLFNCIYHRDGHTDHIYEVIYSEESTAFILKRHGEPCPQYAVNQKVADVARYAKLGNIYENASLLQK